AMTERAADMDPYDADLFVRLAAHHALTQQPGASARMLQRAEELADSPAECQKMLLKAFADMNAFDQAISVYKGLLASGVRLKAEAHHLAGGLHRRQGRLDEAARSYERAIAADPNYAPAYCDLGNVFLTRNDPDRAIQRFREALVRDPNLIPARLNLAQAYTLKGQHAEAQAELQKARELTSPRGRVP
ncbi:MAG: tetratricopeptide repeat protein, partial [Planctomycetes bacterium]|nr:tetratricopeptide repeat protein [Planctomycetota bacterium]